MFSIIIGFIDEIRAIAIGPNPINLTLITSVPVNPICKMLEVLMMVLLFNLRLFLIIRVSVKARIDNVSGWFRWLSFLRFQFSRVFGVPRGFGCSYLLNVCINGFIKFCFIVCTGLIDFKGLIDIRDLTCFFFIFCSGLFFCLCGSSFLSLIDSILFSLFPLVKRLFTSIIKNNFSGQHIFVQLLLLVFPCLVLFVLDVFP